MKMRVINIMASSLDGKISSDMDESDELRKSYGFTNSEDRRLVEEELETADAVIVGANSIRANSKIWSVKNKLGKYPLWIIFTNRGFSKKENFWQQTSVPICFLSQRKIEKQSFWGPNIFSLAYRGSQPAQFAYDFLRNKNVEKVILFGGGHINRIFYQENLVNELYLTVAPMLLGINKACSLVAPYLDRKVSLKLKSSQVSNNHVFLRYEVIK